MSRYEERTECVYIKTEREYGLENVEEYINEGHSEANHIDIHQYINQFSSKYLNRE